MANAYEAATGSAADVADHAFTDVAGDPNEDDIARIAGLGITNGVNDEGTLYGPDDPVIRGHMALFLTRLYKEVAGSEAPAADTEFTDIAERTDEQQAAIGQLFGLGVTTGTSATTYSPTANVTREQMASFVARMYRALDALPDPAEAPGVPTGVEVAISGDAGDALDVSWTAPEDSGTSDVTSYVVQWKSGDDDYSEDNQSSESGTSANFDGLTQGTTYTFRVAATSDDGQSDWSTEASQSPGTVPGTVSDFTVAAGAVTGSLALSWTAPADDGGTPITGYVVEFAAGRNDPSEVQINDGSATSHTLTGLSAGVTYAVRIGAVNAAGAGALTSPADPSQSTSTPTTSIGSGTVQVALPPQTNPADFRGGTKFAAVSWPTPRTDSRRNEELLSFDIQRKCGTQEYDTTASAFDIDGNARSWTIPAANITATAVQVITAGLADTTSGVINTDGALIVGGAPTPEDAEFVAGALTNGEECTYRVRSNTYLDANADGAQQGDSTASGYEPTLRGAWVTGTGTPLGAPGAPVIEDDDNVDTNDKNLEIGDGSLKVSWTAPMWDHDGDDTTPQVVNDNGTPITGYKISWASPASAPLGDTTVSAASRSRTITDLNNGWDYTVKVEAVNARGNSKADPAIGTPLAVPVAPTGVQVSQPPIPDPYDPDKDIRGDRLIITWDALSNATGYQVHRRTSATMTKPVGEWSTPDLPINGTATFDLEPGRTGTDNLGTSYDYRVRATSEPLNTDGTVPDDADWGRWSTVVSGTAADVPLAVDEANVEVIPGDRSLTLTWTPPADEGSEITHYHVQFGTYPLAAWSSPRRVEASALPTYTITRLTNSRQYTVGITPFNAIGRSGPDTDAQSSTGPATVVAGGLPAALDATDFQPKETLSAPSSVTAVSSPTGNSMGNKIDVTWSAVPGAVGYVVEYIKAVEFTASSMEADPSTSEAGPNPATAANWLVSAPASREFCDLDPDVNPGCKVVGVPASTGATGVSGTAINFDATSVSAFDANGARSTTITVATDDTDIGDTFVVRVRAVTTALDGTGLPTGVNYGVPGFSAPVKAVATPAVAPTITDFMQVEKKTTLKVIWTPLSAADARTHKVTGYKVTWYPTDQTQAGNRGSKIVEADATSYEITGLTASAFGTRFAVDVAAVNEIGVGASDTWPDADATPTETAPILIPR